MSVLSSILPVFLMMNHVKGKFLSVYAWSLLSPGEDHCLPAHQLWWCHIWFLQESWDLPPHQAHLQRHWLPLLNRWSMNAFTTMLYVLRPGTVLLIFLYFTPCLTFFSATHGDSQAWLMWPPTIQTCDSVCSRVSIVVVTSIVPCDLLSHATDYDSRLYCSGDIIGHIRTPYCSLWPIVLVTPLFLWRLLYLLLYCSRLL